MATQQLIAHITTRGFVVSQLANINSRTCIYRCFFRLFTDLRTTSRDQVITQQLMFSKCCWLYLEPILNIVQLVPLHIMMSFQLASNIKCKEGWQDCGVDDCSLNKVEGRGCDPHQPHSHALMLAAFIACWESGNETSLSGYRMFCSCQSHSCAGV